MVVVLCVVLVELGGAGEATLVAYQKEEGYESIFMHLASGLSQCPWLVLSGSAAEMTCWFMCAT